MQSVGQSGATSQAPVTLVKSVAAPAGASGVPIPVSINVTMGQGQQKTGLRESLLTTLSGQHTHLVTTVGNALSGGGYLGKRILPETGAMISGLSSEESISPFKKK